MSYSLDGSTIAAAAIVALAVAFAGGRLAMGAKMLPDRPNHRSSHTHVTSRAGGLAIFAAWFVAMAVIGAFSGAPAVATFTAKLCGLAGLALIVGYADDRWALTPAFKFAGQFAVASLYVWVFGPIEMAPLPVVGMVALDPVTGYALTVFWIAGFMNAFNFMDGVNGIAAGCAAIGLAAFAIVAGFSGAPLAAVAALLLGAACFGFLPANMARGRLFMGDSGSQSVSFLIAALAVYAANASDGRVSALIVPVIFLPFILDVAWTLAHRTMRRQNILKAHREHLYQLRNRLGASHERVAVAYMTMTAFAAAGGILMLTLEPSRQALVPGLLGAIFVIYAALTHKDALRDGLFAPPPRHEPEGDVAPTAAE